MRILQGVSTAFALALTIAALACGGSSGTTTAPSAPTPSTPTTPAPVATTTISYDGVFTSWAFNGVFTASAAVPVSLVSGTAALRPLATATATCTYRYGGSTTTNTLTGSYDTATKTFSCTSSVFSLTGTVQTDNTLTGTVHTPAADGGFSASVTVAATPNRTYCGSYAGISSSGKLSITISGATGEITGSAADNGKDSKPLYLRGNATGSQVTITWVFADGGLAQSGTATGLIGSTEVAGRWSNTIGESGSWFAGTTC